MIDGGYGINGVGFGLCGWWNAVNLVLEKRERVSTVGKGRDEIRSEIGKANGMVAYPGKKVWNICWIGDGNWKSGAIADGSWA